MKKFISYMRKNELLKSVPLFMISIADYINAIMSFGDKRTDRFVVLIVIGVVLDLVGVTILISNKKYSKQK